MLKKIKKFLFQFDFTWSIPLSFLTFYLCEILGRRLFGDKFGGYDPSFYQVGVYAASIAIIFNASTLMWKIFNFNTLYKYYINQARTDFNNLSPINKILIFIAMYWGMMIFQVYIWQKLVFPS